MPPKRNAAAVTLRFGVRPEARERGGRQRLLTFPVLPAAIAAAMGAAGCDVGPATDRDSGLGVGVTVRDSAGIEIVENHSPEWPPGEFWTLDPEPGFVLGAGEPSDGTAAGVGRDDRDGRIWEVAGVARLVDGRIAVLSQGNHQLFIFEPSGKLSRAIGGKGEGPGEFVRPQRMQYLPPDTLVVWDHWMGPVTYFDTAGAVLDRRRIDLGKILAEVPGASLDSPTIPLPDGSFVVSVDHRDPGFPSPAKDSFVRYPPIEYVRVDRDTYVGRSLGIWDGEQVWAVPEDVLGSYSMLRRGEHGLVSFDGQLTSQMTAGGHPATIYITNGNNNEVRQFSIEGALLRIIRRTTAPLVVTEEADVAWREYALEWGGGEWGVEAWPKRELHPAMSALVVDAAGYLWVREWSESESGMPDQWSVFGPEGRWLGVVIGSPAPALCYAWPAPIPCWIDRDWLVLLKGDPLGRERIEGYRIHRDIGER